MKILVRSRKDASAVKHAIERILGTSSYIVESLGGLRGEDLCSKLEERIEPFSIIIFGKNEIPDCAWDITNKTPFATIIPARTSKLRNSTLEMIISLLNWGRAKIRLTYSWERTFILSSHKGATLTEIPVHPEGDAFLLVSQGIQTILSLIDENLSQKLPSNAVGIFYKSSNGLHVLYLNNETRIALYLDRKSSVPKITETSFSNESKITETTSLEELVNSNNDVFKLLEKYSLETFEKWINNRKHVIVPLSGGKDSAAALVLASIFFDPSRIHAIYVDTGIDFFENNEYVEYLTDKLGVDLVKVKADIDKGLLEENMPLPDPNYRWCTGRKLDALRRAIRELARKYDINTIIVGDRDAESVRRSLRPPMRIDDSVNLNVVSPLKFWSGAHVQAYLLWKGFKLNPLYEYGFVRLGCYLCFALRPSWEIYIMKRINYFEKIKQFRPEHSRLISLFLNRKRT